MELCSAWDHLPESVRDEYLKYLVPMYIKYLVDQGRYAEAAALGEVARKYVGSLADYLDILADFNDIVNALQNLDLGTVSVGVLKSYLARLEDLLQWLSSIRVTGVNKEALANDIRQVIDSLESLIQEKENYDLLREATEEAASALEAFSEAVKALSNHSIEKGLEGLGEAFGRAAQALDWLRENESRAGEYSGVFKAYEGLMEELADISSAMQAGLTALQAATKFLHKKASDQDEALHHLEQAFTELAAGFRVLENT